MARKTVNVADLVESCNKTLKTHTGDRMYRLAVQVFLEDILHQTGNYKGFRYLLRDEVPLGEEPGIHYENGMPLPYPQRFENTDSTRVQY